ncbi:hypothetical protein PFISCL1PPCAC_7777, partial [Pristionchus fissidentatus]
MGQLSPHEEERLAHSYHNYSLVGFFFLCISLIPALYTAYDHRHYSVHLPAQNFGWVFDIGVAAGRTFDVSIDEVDYRHYDGAFEYQQIIGNKFTPEQVARVYANPWAVWKYKRIVAEPKRHAYRIPNKNPTALA